MDIHSPCQRMAKYQMKSLGIRAKDFQTVKTGSNRWDVYRGGKVGQYQGCCKWSAMSVYLTTLEMED